MGILDDAIRQHLELKRQHGADPSDVAKLEHEAFGPVEREEADRETAREEEHPYAEAELEAEEERAAEPPAPEPGSVAYVPPPVERPRAEPAPLPEPRPAAPVEDPGERADALAAEPDAAPGEHDELEETPEHDRLWFEQKPPRDFDF